MHGCTTDLAEVLQQPGLAWTTGSKQPLLLLWLQYLLLAQQHKHKNLLLVLSLQLQTLTSCPHLKWRPSMPDIRPACCSSLHQQSRQ